MPERSIRFSEYVALPEAIKRELRNPDRRYDIVLPQGQVIQRTFSEMSGLEQAQVFGAREIRSAEAQRAWLRNRLKANHEREGGEEMPPVELRWSEDGKTLIVVTENGLRIPVPRKQLKAMGI
jgi:hypothetical protein